jgi:hypothetical protein
MKDLDIMTRLIAPIGHSRMNLFAAIKRLQPKQVLLITSKTNHHINVEAVKKSVGLPNLKIDLYSISDVFDTALMAQEMRELEKSFPKQSNDIVLTSGSTNPVSMICWILWGPRNINIMPDGLISNFEGEEQMHVINEKQFLQVSGLEIIDEKITCQGVPLFPGSDSNEVNPSSGNIKIVWKFGRMKGNYERYMKDLKKKMHTIFGLWRASSRLYGSKTFHHHLIGQKAVRNRIPEENDNFSFEMEEEE